MSRAGRWGLALLALHTALLLVPAIPPILNGSSVPGYLLSLAVVALLAVEAGRRSDALLAWWWRAANVGRRTLATLIPLAFLALALAFRAALPETFYRFQREEGLFEPLTLLCYVVAAIFLWRAGAAATPERRKPWRLLAAFYIWLALEEVDYFSVFGGMIGRIRGEYAGSLHDVIRLTALGIMGQRAWVFLGTIALAAAAVLWRTGYLAPRWVLARIADPRALWGVAGMAFLWVAASEEAHFFGLTFAPPTPEEAIELAGGLYLLLYALEEASVLFLGPSAGSPDDRIA